MKKIEIFVATHKKFEQKLPNNYVKLLVGSYNKEKMDDYVSDSTGLNISKKNANYCELTGLYWIWKNVNDKFVGLCHYRRYFSIGYGKILKTKKALKILNKYDIIVPMKGYSKKRVYDTYKEKHIEKDLINCKRIIENKYPEYEESFDIVMNQTSIYPCNMFITSKNLMDKYCSWLFDILFELEKETNLENYDDYQKRIFGFLSERLLNVWILKNNLKIKEINMWINENNYLQEKKRILNLYIQKLQLKLEKGKKHYE